MHLYGIEKNEIYQIVNAFNALKEAKYLLYSPLYGFIYNYLIHLIDPIIENSAAKPQ